MNEYTIAFLKYFNDFKKIELDLNTLAMHFNNIDLNLNICFPKELISKVNVLLFSFSIKNKKVIFYFIRNEAQQFVSFKRILNINDGKKIYGNEFDEKHFIHVKKIEEFVQSLINKELIC